ncbi:hypothetical protein [Limosilactobacillus reuteri]|uniref:hypothetical protein n=1 Tax=Limosilactobacillus reuteri TaxID=1598 RepID=UPI00155A87A5|nr:hypothetical protein [Limosilactobacillus reuteri]
MKWINQHKLITAVVAIFIVIVILVVIGSGTNCQSTRPSRNTISRWLIGSNFKGLNSQS